MPQIADRVYPASFLPMAASVLLTTERMIPAKTLSASILPEQYFVGHRIDIRPKSSWEYAIPSTVSFPTLPSYTSIVESVPKRRAWTPEEGLVHFCA